MAKRSKDDIAADIRSQLRGILRLRELLLNPPVPLIEDRQKPTGEPRYYLRFFNDRPPQKITGLKGRTSALSLPHEHLVAEVANFAKAVWHLKDWLCRWGEVTGSAIKNDIEDHAEPSPELMICADLANMDKHGESRSKRSRRNPQLDPEVELDTSRSGLIEFYYNGVTKEHELLVENRAPVSHRVRVLVDDKTTALPDDAVTVIDAAFRHWIPLVARLQVLADDNPESVHLRSALGLSV